MKKNLIITVVAVIVGIVATYAFSYYRAKQQQLDLLSRLHMVEQTLSETKRDLLGYTKYTDYLSTTKSVISEQMKFLASKVDREYVHIEHIEKSKIGLIKFEATVIVKYAVEYSVGYDLRPDSFAVSGDNSSITISLKRPELVASPSVRIISHEIPSKGFLIDEKAAVIALQQQLPDIAKKNGESVKAEEAIVALCEKKLAEFLRNFLSKQPNVRVVPTIKFSYQ